MAILQSTSDDDELKFKFITDFIISDDQAWIVSRKGDRLSIADNKTYTHIVERLRQSISEHDGEEEWSLIIEGASYRCSRMDTVDGYVFIFRVGIKGFLKLSSIYPQSLADLLLSSKLNHGLVVFSGPMTSGKTTSSASMIVERLIEYSGHAVTIEDPPELPLQGKHGKGHCFQTQAKNGDFESGMIRMMRYNPSIIFLGEIRDTGCAREALRASVNGHLVIATIHASGVSETLSRIEALSGNPSLMADGLSLIINQRLTVTGVEPKMLFIKDKTHVKEMIRRGEYSKLSTEIRLQKNQLTMNQAFE
jgi:twitching motility protein PilT